MKNDEQYAIEIIEKWFNSDEWESICQSAEMKDEDSIELMENVNDRLGSLCWHLQNCSGSQRVGYEIKFFVDLCNDFDIPTWS